MVDVPYRESDLFRAQWARSSHPHLALIPTQPIFESKPLQILNLPHFNQIKIDQELSYGRRDSRTGYWMPSAVRQKWQWLESQLLEISDLLGTQVFQGHNLDFRFGPYPMPSKTGIHSVANSVTGARKRVLAAARSMMVLIAWTSLGVVLVNSVHRREYIDNFIPGYWEEKLEGAGLRRDVIECLAATPIGDFSIPRTGMIVDPFDCPYLPLVQIFIRLKVPVWCYLGKSGWLLGMGHELTRLLVTQRQVAVALQAQREHEREQEALFLKKAKIMAPQPIAPVVKPEDQAPGVSSLQSSSPLETPTSPFLPPRPSHSGLFFSPSPSASPSRVINPPARPFEPLHPRPEDATHPLAHVLEIQAYNDWFIKFCESSEAKSLRLSREEYAKAKEYPAKKNFVKDIYDWEWQDDGLDFRFRQVPKGDWKRIWRAYDDNRKWYDSVRSIWYVCGEEGFTFGDNVVDPEEEEAYQDWLHGPPRSPDASGNIDDADHIGVDHIDIDALLGISVPDTSEENDQAATKVVQDSESSELTTAADDSGLITAFLQFYLGVDLSSQDVVPFADNKLLSEKRCWFIYGFQGLESAARTLVDEHPHGWRNARSLISYLARKTDDEIFVPPFDPDSMCRFGDVRLPQGLKLEMLPDLYYHLSNISGDMEDVDDNDQCWELIVQSASALIEAFRALREGEEAIGVKTVARHLLQRKVKFSTVVSSYPEIMQESNLYLASLRRERSELPLGQREQGYILTPFDLDLWRTKAKRFLSKACRARAAFTEGGIIARIALHLMGDVPDAVLRGPSSDVTLRGLGKRLKGVEHDGNTASFMDDSLSIEEVSLLCGVFLVPTGVKNGKCNNSHCTGSSLISGIVGRQE